MSLLPSRRPSERPLVAIPARFSASASALRYAAEVAPRALLTAVFDAGGEPVVLHPHAPGAEVDVGAVAARLQRFEAVLLPGGGDVSPHWFAGASDPSLYDMDLEQDAFDIAVARWALGHGIPLLAICRGMQVVNVARGGSLLADMPSHHRHVLNEVAVAAGSLLAGAVGADPLRVSCYHHQAVDRLGAGLRAVTRAADGTIEAIEAVNDHAEPGGWFVGVQWHPEDTAATDPRQHALFAALVGGARPVAAGSPA